MTHQVAIEDFEQPHRFRTALTFCIVDVRSGTSDKINFQLARLLQLEVALAADLAWQRVALVELKTSGQLSSKMEAWGVASACTQTALMFDEDNTHDDVERILDHFADLAVEAVFAEDRNHDAVLHQADATRIHQRFLSHDDAFEC